MAGYLDNYGVSDAKRERKMWRVAGIVFGSALVCFAAYVFFHDFRERRQVSRFFDLLKEKQYEQAYLLWGCEPAHPCRDYNMDRFMEDWGPKSSHSDISRAHVRRSRSCDGGVIQIVEFAPGDEVLLYVDRDKRFLSFSPFPYCVDATGKNTKLIDIFFR